MVVTQFQERYEFPDDWFAISQYGQLKLNFLMGVLAASRPALRCDISTSLHSDQTPCVVDAAQRWCDTVPHGKWLDYAKRWLEGMNVARLLKASKYVHEVSVQISNSCPCS